MPPKDQKEERPENRHLISSTQDYAQSAPSEVQKLVELSSQAEKEPPEASKLQL